MLVTFEVAILIEEFVADNDPPYLHVGVADAAGAHYIMLHRSQPFNDDRDWGIYIEVNDQRFGGYDCIASCELTAKKMVVRLCQPLGNRDPVDAIEARFSPGNRPSPAFIARLRAVFAGYESQLSIVDADDSARRYRRWTPE
jgi:hypothetical protein